MLKIEPLLHTFTLCFSGTIELLSGFDLIDKHVSMVTNPLAYSTTKASEVAALCHKVHVDK